MQKISSLFQRNYDGDRLVRNEVVPGTEWVVAGMGRATQKHDGTACLVKDGQLYKRYDVKGGRLAPMGFIPAQDPDERTGHWPGWLAVGPGPEDKWFRQAHQGNEPDGTYELCGPKVQGNPEHLEQHTLIPHGSVELPDAPRDFDGLNAYFATRDIEGIVWHHPDGRMVKIKARDFGLKRGK